MARLSERGKHRMTDDELQRLDTEPREAFEHWARQLEAAGESE